VAIFSSSIPLAIIERISLVSYQFDQWAGDAYHDFPVYKAVVGASAYDVFTVCTGAMATREEGLTCACLTNVALG
jgi:hypothetical protein